MQSAATALEDFGEGVNLHRAFAPDHHFFGLGVDRDPLSFDSALRVGEYKSRSEIGGALRRCHVVHTPGGDPAAARAGCFIVNSTAGAAIHHSDKVSLWG